jgi:spore maturation protein CgeB
MNGMKIVIFGLSITSSWGNGHATTFRALCRALHARGHRIIFYEKNTEWYAHNRDLPNPGFCETHIFENWDSIRSQCRRELSDTDVAIVGSYFPDGIAALDEVLDSSAAVKAFYDIDTPITLAQLRERGGSDYVTATQIARLDVYFSFTGGPALRELEHRFSARCAVPLYCSVDPEQYHSFPIHRRYQCDLSYMGTYAPDRQPGIEAFLCEPARRMPELRFIVAGPQYPKTVRWPANVRRITHLNPRWHPRLYTSSRLVLNVTRRDMVLAGWSPSVRLFEAAACGATIISDNWPGLEDFLLPGREILLPTTADDVRHYLKDLSPAELSAIGQHARERILAEHTSAHRARYFENMVQQALHPAAVLAS